MGRRRSARVPRAPKRTVTRRTQRIKRNGLLAGILTAKARKSPKGSLNAAKKSVTRIETEVESERTTLRVKSTACRRKTWSSSRVDCPRSAENGTLTLKATSLQSVERVAKGAIEATIAPQA